MSRYVTLVWKKNKIVNVSFYAESCQITVFTNSAGFLIRCMRLFDAIREELVPYGTQTFPSVAVTSPIKYGAGWKKEELPEKDFRDYSLVLFP